MRHGPGPGEAEKLERRSFSARIASGMVAMPTMRRVVEPRYLRPQWSPLSLGKTRSRRAGVKPGGIHSCVRDLTEVKAGGVGPT